MKPHIGVFDSGVGGLSVLRALLAAIPDGAYTYIADSAYAPYGDKGDAYVIERSTILAEYLLDRSQAHMLVVACNTATAAAVKALRENYPQIPVVGIEPAIKPAIALSHSKRIGVMATRGTVQSQAFQNLRGKLETENPAVQFQVLICEGLAKAIEDGFRSGDLAAAKELARYFAKQFDSIDTLVLGCTHYPFLQDQLQAELGESVHIIEPSAAVAQQAKRLLHSINLADTTRSKALQLYSSGDTGLLQAASNAWLGLDIVVQALDSNP